MPRRVLLVDLGAGPLPATTTPLVVSSTWMPKAYTPPAIATPTSLTATPIADAALLQFVPTADTETVIEAAPNVAGAPGTWAVVAQTSDARYALALPAGAVRWVRAKAVKNGRSSAYTAQTLATSINVTQVDLTSNNALANTLTAGVANGAFETDLTGWADAWGAGLTGWAIEAGGVLGTKHLAKSGGATGSSGIYNVGGGLAVSSGQTIVVRIAVRSDSTPAGAIAFGLAGYDASGTYIQDLGGWSAAGTIVAANCAGAYKLFQKVVKNTNANVVKVRAAFSVHGYVAGKWSFDSMDVHVLPSTLDEVPDGSSFARVSVNCLIGNTVGLYQANSGHQIGGQENLLPISVASFSSRWDGLSITYSVPTTGTPATVTINASAATLRMGSAKSYAASSVAVSQARSTTAVWHLYYIDPTFAGGSKTLNATTDPNTLVNSTGIVWVGPVEITTPSVGTGASGSGIPGGGCVVETAYMADGRQARDWRPGDASPCWSPREGFSVRECLVVSEKLLRPCVRLTTTSGYSLTLSADTPIDVPRDPAACDATVDSVLASAMLDRPIRAWRGVADRRFEFVISVDDVGWRWVIPFGFGGRSFPAGDQPHVLFETHNADKP